MSRMLALSAPRSATPPTRTFEAFLAQATVHSDGWGHARVSSAADAATVVTGLAAADGLRSELTRPATASLSYLRFASRGAEVSEENLQPFAADGVVFMHNGALVPRSTGLDALTPRERARLRGTTDSEVYFALVRRTLAASRGCVAQRVGDGVALTRSLYPDACLNAMLLVDGEVVVVASRGTVPAPVAALGARGISLAPDRIDAYNVLFETGAEHGPRIVASSGVEGDGWEPIPDGHVITYFGGWRTAVARVPRASGTEPAF